jgi:circadian clock protein KaiB
MKNAQARSVFKFRPLRVGEAHNSAQAIAKLRVFCREFLETRHEIEIIDVLCEPKPAQGDGGLLTPMLVKLFPASIRKILGNLNQREPLLLALGLLLR